MSGTRRKPATVAARRPRGELVKVRIAERCTVYHDGVAYLAGQVVDVPKADATAMLEAGLAEPAK